MKETKSEKILARVAAPSGRGWTYSWYVKEGGRYKFVCYETPKINDTKLNRVMWEAAEAYWKKSGITVVHGKPKAKLVRG